MRRAFIAAFFLLFSTLVPAYAETSNGESWNLRTSPLGLIGGEANLRLDYAFAEKWTLGPEIGVIDRDISGIDERAVGGGLFFGYHFNGAFTSGAFLDGGLGFAHERARDKISGISASFNDTNTRFIAGYHWFWNFVNLSLGGGLGTHSAGKVVIRDSSGKEVDHVDIRPVSMALDFSIGLVF